MPDCWAKGCKSRNYESRKSKIQLQWERSHNQKITFHKIPKNPEERQKWLESMGLNGTDIPQNAKLCSLHFEESAFDRRADYYIKIRPGAIPFENISVSNVEPPRKKLKVHHTIQEAIIDPKTTEEILDTNTEQETVHTRSLIQDKSCTIDCHSNIFATATIENSVINTSNTYQGIDVVSQINTPPEVKHQGTVVSPHLSEDTPRKRILRAALTNTRKDLNKKIKYLQQKYRRSTKRIANLKNVLAALKKKRLLDLHQLDILNGLGTFNKQLLMRQDSKIHKTRMRKQYEPELRSFALTLHFYSPQAYAFVRKKFDTCLPHPKTIYEWYKSINGEPGFNEEALQSIKQRAELVNYPLFGVLIFDEMAIRRHVEYDGKKFWGYVDLGPDIDCGDIIAKEALVFLVNVINQPLKIPIGYFLINGLNAEQKSNLVTQALKALDEHNIKIIALTFDGAPANLTMCNILGCNLTPTTSFQTYFSHPTTKDKVAVFLDPCHSLKLLRNCLGDHKSIIDDKGNMIRWEYFKTS